MTLTKLSSDKDTKIHVRCEQKLEIDTGKDGSVEEKSRRYGDIMQGVEFGVYHLRTLGTSES